MLRRLLRAHVVDEWHWFGVGTPLSVRRERIQRWTRPALFASTLAIAPASALVGEWVGEGEQREPKVNDVQSVVDLWAEAASLLPLGAASGLGALWAITHKGGFNWLPHLHERLAWVGAFSWGVLACAQAMWPTLTAGMAPSPPDLGSSAAMVLAATATERLGGRAGRIATIPLAAAAALAVAGSVAGDSRASRQLEGCALVYFPLLLACPPVHTNTSHLAVAALWFGAAAAYRVLDQRDPNQRLKPLSHVFLAFGTFSLAWGIRSRAPICQY